MELLPFEEELEMGMETDDKDEGGGHPPEGQHSQVDAKELEILEGVVAYSQKLTLPPKTGDK